MTITTDLPQHSPELRAAARHIGRRRFLTVTGAAAALAFAVNLPTAGTAGAAELDARRITDNPFTLGIASGDPLPDSVLLWTRLAPAPYQPDSGLPAQRITVYWELAHDEKFTRIARRGAAIAYPEFHHTVHVEVSHLPSDRVYYYRFRTGTWISAAGRTRTAPARTGAASSSPSPPSPARPTPTATTRRTAISPRTTSTSSSTSAITCTSTRSTPSAATATTPTAPCPRCSTARR